jgi:hypothetical protein
MKEGNILVATWGYSMILATFVRVIKVSPKSILVEELLSSSATDGDRAAAGIKPSSQDGFLQTYVVPSTTARQRNGEKNIIRLYSRGMTESVEKFITMKDGYQKEFTLWDGKPVFEDHCD